jgi:DTW domain-containing protein YfiP
MSKRRSPDENRCPKCRIHKKLCFCDEIKTFNNNVKVTIIMHHREEHLTTNTATLATKLLINSKIVKRGLPDAPFMYDQLDIKEDEIPLYLFPHEASEVLEGEFLKSLENKKIHLIIPDGTWSQAKKVYRREHGFNDMKCVKLPEGITSNYKLRKTPRVDGVCTFEAISHALGFLESREMHLEMIKIFSIMVARFIKSRTSFHSPLDDISE